ncbi:probable E3 ubiquitin-protein ligase HERC4 [Poeciliopsis prolifica]|uniref:probable E3 ubiquitin-protein ligase HERC4 n=1 Tax=Poeciliopsis prolifica TaxID=188132 RepID=UPI002413A737|nr:probable E3 ubiquitin-protein ligase HERC4 [Poeciliopsis prolifica]
MFCWGEDYRRSFRQKKASDVPTSDRVHFLNLSFHIRDLSAARNVLAFAKDVGDASVIRAQGKQKFVDCGEKIRAVCCGDDVVTLLSDAGKIFCVDPNATPFTPRPPPVLSSVTVTQIACGSHHTVALTKDDQVYTWGQDSRGQLGLGGSHSGAGSPQHVRSLSAIPVVRISAGGEHSFALTVSGGVFGWGRNDCGQLGLGDTEDRTTPAPVSYLNTKKVIHISSGQEHTVALTKDGAVFTFGSGRYGQLGHNSFRNELRPRLVAELWGAKVTKTACGRYHTLVLTDRMKVYSFGCNDHQQLGRDEESLSVPLPVQIPLCPTNGHRIDNIFAGADCSFATWRPKEDGLNSKINITQQPIENLVDQWTSECDARLGQVTKQEIRRTFSSASIVNRSFLDQRKDKHFQTSTNYPGFDLLLAKSVFEKLLTEDVLQTEVEKAVLLLLPRLDNKPVGLEGLRVFLVLTELLHVTQKHCQPQISSTSLKLVEEIIAAFQRLSPESLRIIGDWWHSLLPSTMVRHVNVWKTALSWPFSHNSFNSILLILQNLFEANRKKIPENKFCVEFDRTFLEVELQRWRGMSLNRSLFPQMVDDQPLLLCDFPFVMDLKSKKMVFDTSAAWTQEDHQRVFVPPFGGTTQSNPYFELHLSRASLLEEAFAQLAAAHQTDLKKPLVVHLDGDSKVTRVYRSDFFHHLNIVQEKREMFMLNESERLAWFSSRADQANFHLLGILCGLALYNDSFIQLPFPLVLFKKLLDIEPTLEDMMEFNAGVGRHLQYILDYEDDLEDLCITFEINWDERNVDLDPSNPGKLVTNQNKKEFVDAYVNYAFNQSVEGMFQEFKHGFFLVCDQQLVKLFRPEELQGVLVGGDVYNWAKLKQNTQYEWISDRHPTMQMFWDVFDELTEEQKKDFILFLTGFRKVPVLGMDQIRMKIRIKQIQSGSPDEHFPESLTCHSILELPLYSTKEIMRERLTEALEPDRGFRA